MSLSPPLSHPRSVIMAPSILSADLLHLQKEIKEVEEGGADMHHVDVMDGHFVPNLTFGLELIRQLKTISTIPIDVHIMVSNPDEVAQQYLDAGADRLSFHVEATAHSHRLAHLIKSQNKAPGVAVNPATPVTAVFDVLDHIEHVLLMSVNPGFGGQSFIPRTEQKCIQLAKEIQRRSLPVHIQVDGGIDTHTIGIMSQAGARSFVAGSAVYKATNRHQALSILRSRAHHHLR